MKRTKLFQRITVIIITVSVVAGFSHLFPLETGNVPKARATGEKMILLWDTGLGGSVPTGWTAGVGTGATYAGYFPRGNAALGSATTPTHTHTQGTVAVVASSTGANRTRTGVTVSNTIHTHSTLTTFTMNTATPSPAYRDLIPISCDSGIPTTLPQFAIAIFDAAVGTGFSGYAGQNGYMIRFNSTSGGFSSTNTHSHANLSIVTSGPSATVAVASGTDPRPSSAHTHSYTGTSPISNDDTPLHTEVVLGSVTNSGGTAIPAGMIAMFNGDPNIDSSSWDIISNGGGEAFYQVFMEAQTGYQTGQGSATHTHALSVVSLGASATTGVTTSTTPPGATAAAHTHTISGNFSSESNTPAYIDVVVAKKLAVYTPKSTEWRWCDAEQTTDPADTLGTDILAGDTIGTESHAPASTRIVYDGNALKLRFGVTETGATAGTDVKFHLEYDTSNSFSSATDVGGVGQMVIWRYYNGVDTDDTSITTRLLTTTAANGTHNETGGSTSSSTFDPAASTATEFEFTIQNNGATANTQYFFRLYYIENSGGTDTPAGVVSPVVGNNYPTLTTAAAYDLEVSTAPASVSYGSVTVGTNTKQYVFAAGEKIGFWDKRSTASAYTVSVSGTDMTNGGNTIDHANITWTSTTGVLNVGFTSVTTNMTGQTGATLDASRTAYAASAGYGKGGFYFSPTIDLTGLWNKATGNYTGIITITIA